MTERQRCGRCMAGDHEHCVVVVEMAHRERPNQPSVPYCGAAVAGVETPIGWRADTLQKAEGRAPG
jgi:hypothetical protein